jgi:hypothetical protein
MQHLNASAAALWCVLLYNAPSQLLQSDVRCALAVAQWETAKPAVHYSMLKLSKTLHPVVLWLLLPAAAAR